MNKLPTNTVRSLIKQQNIELPFMRSRHPTVEMHDLSVVVLCRGNFLSAKLSVKKPLLHTDWMFDIYSM